MISLLVPSRGRPDNLERLYESLCRCQDMDWELLVRLDDDDPTKDDYRDHLQVTFITGPRVLLSKTWNELARHATGDILWHGGDDVTFRTINWSEIVASAFPPDNIAFVHGHDLSPNGDWLGTHGFLHRKWVETVGYFVPPYFSSDYNDLWLVRVAEALHRRIYVPIVTEHWHPSFNKATWDLTHLERLQRHWNDDVDGIWDRTALEREADVAKLRAVMNG